MINIFGLFVEQ